MKDTPLFYEGKLVRNEEDELNTERDSNPQPSSSDRLANSLSAVLQPLHLTLVHFWQNKEKMEICCNSLVTVESTCHDWIRSSKFFHSYCFGSGSQDEYSVLPEAYFQQNRGNKSFFFGKKISKQKKYVRDFSANRWGRLNLCRCSNS